MKTIKLNTNYKKKQEFNKDNILEDYNLSKFFFILHTNFYVFDWELKKKYNFTTTQIQKFSTLLEQWQYLSYNLLSELDLNMMEMILKTSPDADKIYKSNPKVYTITKTGRKEGRELVTQLLKDSDNNESIYLFVKDLMQQSQSKRLVLKQIQDEEKGLIYRKVNIPGFPYQLELPSKIITRALKELPKSNKNKVSTDIKLQNNHLLVVDNNIFNRNVLEFTNSDEQLINNQNKGVIEKEFNIVEKEHKKQIQEKLQNLYQETGYYSKKDHLLEHRPYEETIGKYFLGNKKESVEEGLNFLDSLL